MTGSTHSHTEVETPHDHSILEEKSGKEIPVDDTAKEGAKGNNDNDDDTIVYPSGMTLTLIIVALCLAVFLVALDQTIIAPALGAITAEYKSVKDIVSTTNKEIGGCHGPCSVCSDVLTLLPRAGMAPLTSSPPRLSSQCTAPSTSSSTSSGPTWLPYSSSRWAV
jgi:hypothetical protein